MKAHLILLMAFLLLPACRPSDLGVENELRIQSETTGLALIGSRGSNIVVSPFGSKDRYFRVDQTRRLKLVGTSGRTIIWLDRPRFSDTGRYTIEAINGRRTTVLDPPSKYVFDPLALNEAANSMIFWGSLRPKQNSEGLYWASLDFVDIGFIDRSNASCDWSPVGDRVVYEKEGQIYLFDIAKKSSKLLVQGHDPTWSPSGEWIAYRSVDNIASLVRLGGESVNWPIRLHHTDSAIRWSPDGRYVSFSEPIQGPHIPYITTYYRLLVCRVSDGKTVVAREFGYEGTGRRNVYWILGYTEFCAACASGEPFN